MDKPFRSHHLTKFETSREVFGKLSFSRSLVVCVVSHGENVFRAITSVLSTPSENYFAVFSQEFFSSLEGHRAMLDALAACLDPVTRQRHEEQHAQLVQQTNALLDRAAVRGHKLETLTTQWENYEPEMEEAKKQLHNLHQQYPSKVSKNSLYICIKESVCFSP